MSAHYRSPVNYSNIQLESASDRIFYIYEVLLSLGIIFFLLALCGYQSVLFAHFIFYAFAPWVFLNRRVDYLQSFVCLQTLHECESFLSQHGQTIRKDSIPPDTLNIIDKFHDVFQTSMSDDLHTPVVLAGMSDPLKSINDLLHTRKV